VIVHAAGVNRATSDSAVADGNPTLAKLLTESMRRGSVRIPLVYSNSTHSDGDSVYGFSKREAAEILAAYQAEVGAPFLDLVLPHLFGEFGRPHYNSAVTTFAYELATGGSPTVNRDGRLELLHAQDVAIRCLAFARGPGTDRERMAGTAISVGDVWQVQQQQHHRYVHERTVPSFSSRFELRLFNTLRSQLYETGFYPRALAPHADQRGVFVELMRSDGTGQTSFSTSEPSVSRGDHFHFDKIERFIVVGGSATIQTRRVLSDDLRTYKVSGDAPVFIDMPPLVTHKIVNRGDELLTTMFWAGDHFDPAQPDTWIDPVEI